MPDHLDAPRILVNFAEAHQLGHVVEALRYVEGHRTAVPDAHIGLVLNSATPLEMASWSAAVDDVFDVPMYGSPADVATALARIPQDWDYILDNPRRHQPAHADAVPGFAAYYQASDRYFDARLGHGLTARKLPPTPGYVRDQHVRVHPPSAARERVRAVADSADPLIALLPAGSSERWLYPSAEAWVDVIGALFARFPDARIVLIGKHVEDGRTTSAFSQAEVDLLRAAQRERTIDGFDLPLAEQLALVEAADVFVSTHSGFGWAALAVDTPWLAISGGRWPEVFFNHVPFVSLLPDPDRFGRYSLYGEPQLLDDDEGTGPRSPHASRGRIRADLDRIVDAADTLIRGTIDYDTAMRDHFAATLDYLGEHRDALFAIDAIHLGYVDAPTENESARINSC